MKHGYEVEDFGLDQAELERQQAAYWDEIPYQVEVDAFASKCLTKVGDLYDYEAGLENPEQEIEDAIRPALGYATAHRLG